jgi:hypothetical protein
MRGGATPGRPGGFEVHTMREKRRAGARPAALAVAVIAALLVPAGAAAADTGQPAEESGVVAEPTPVEAEPAAEPVVQPAAEPAPVEVVAPEAPAPVDVQDSTPVTTSDDDTVVVEPDTTPDPTPVEIVPGDSSSTPQDTEDESADLQGDVSFVGTVGEWYQPMATVGSTITAVEDGFPSDTTVAYVWTVAGEPRGTAATYTPSEEDLGQQIYVSWTATAPGWNALNGGQRVAWDTLPRRRGAARHDARSGRRVREHRCLR